MGVESPLGAPQGAFSHVPHSRVTWGQRDEREVELPFPAGA